MQVVADHRPSHELSDSEILAHLFQRIRVEGMTRAKQVQDECDRLFPDLGAERKRQCLAQLARRLRRS